MLMSNERKRPREPRDATRGGVNARGSAVGRGDGNVPS